jgi:CRISPR/Cas system-associated exonuclease Cas4 (RecB family)
MSQYYNPRRKRNLYSPEGNEPFKISRSKIDLFLECPRCFYLDRRLGVARPPGYPFALNSAVDSLLKKEFDRYRQIQAPHPLMQQNGVDAVPFNHPKIDLWRDNFTGVQYHDPVTNFIIFGAVDDIWQKPDDSLIIVDYKSTSKSTEITLDAEWQNSYKRQMEIYQWLMRRNGFEVDNTGYFVYCNGITDRDVFDSRLDFDINLLSYTGDDSWIGDVVSNIHECLNSEMIPDADAECDYCSYRKAVKEVKNSV